jgi:hypothetical protein
MNTEQTKDFKIGAMIRDKNGTIGTILKVAEKKVFTRVYHISPTVKAFTLRWFYKSEIEVIK